MTRKIYNEDFKIAAAMLARGQGYTLKKAAESLGVDPGSIRLWVRKYAPVTAAPALDASPEQLQRENQRLREENRRLLMEREILPLNASITCRQFLAISRCRFGIARVATRSRSATRSAPSSR